MFNKEKNIPEEQLQCPWTSNYGFVIDYTFASRLFHFLARMYKDAATLPPGYEEEYEMIAQGGGEFRNMHRCAGEWITLHSMRVFSDQLVNKYNFSIPEQDWTVPMNQFPTYPNSKALLFKE